MPHYLLTLDARRSPVDVVVIDVPSMLQARMAAVVRHDSALPSGRTVSSTRFGPLRAISVSASA
jgi:hypothetical protein